MLGYRRHRLRLGVAGHIAKTVLFLAFAFTLSLAPRPGLAQHIDWVLGTGGLLTPVQPPPGIYYVNQPVFYWANNDRTIGRFTANASLDLFLDFNTFLWVSPWRILGAKYAADVTIPLVNTNGSLDIAALGGRPGLSRGTSEFGLSSIYVEPVNLGWHLPRYDVTASFGFFAPAGSYNPQRIINTGLGRWAEMGSLGAVAYLDDRRQWYLDGWTRYLTHQGQQGIDIRVGDDFIVEYGAGRQFKTNIGPVNLGLVGYAYWQVTNTTGSVVPPAESHRRGSVYGLGPEINATTKYGVFSLRYYGEFGASNTPQGNVVMLGWTL